MDLSGEIPVAQVVGEAQRQQESRARMARSEERIEEQAVCRAYWQATEKDRPELARKHRAVFARIRANRLRAQAIERTERAFQDRRMRHLGYRIRPGRIYPRYVRP